LRGLTSSLNAPSSLPRPSGKVHYLLPSAQSSILTSPLTADIVQELYLRELKSYKPPPLKASDAEEHVLKFSAPKPPSPPEETDIANELKAYEAQPVELEGQAGSEGGAAPINEDWFEEEPEEGDHAKH
jgi:F-type H+-transporting ATPase subunit h